MTFPVCSEIEAIAHTFLFSQVSSAPLQKGLQGRGQFVLEKMPLNFIELLTDRKHELAQKWGDLLLGTYPEETQAIWKGKKNKFSNPIGTAIEEGTVTLFDLLLEWDDADRIKSEMEHLVKIRAIQNYEPSKAISFIYLLKKMLREEFMDELEAQGQLVELLKFETRVDNMALMAFDVYAKTRETVFESRVKEVKNAQYNLLRRANMIVDSTAAGADKS